MAEPLYAHGRALVPLSLLGLLATICFAPPAWPDSAPEAAFQLSETDLRYYDAWGISEEDAEFFFQILGAQRALAKGDIWGSLPYFERALELRPDSIPTHHGLGLALVRLNRPRQALPHFERVIGTGVSAEASAHTNLGRIKGGMRRRDEALAHFEKAVELNPDQAEVQYNLGVSYYRHERFEDALPHLQLAARLDPTRTGSHRWLANAYATLGRHAEAIASYQVLLQINDQDAGALQDMGVSYEALGDDALARSYFERALTLAKTNPRYRGLQKLLEERLATP